jgi:hypothetical protein
MSSSDGNLEGRFNLKYLHHKCQLINIDELQLAIEEIQKNERELKSILQVTEFLFDNREDLQYKLE